MKLLFFPGGPGFNSNPELVLLKQKYAEAGIDLQGWHEPSGLRIYGDVFTEENAFENYVTSAERFFLQHCNNEPVNICGFSFGSHPVKYLLKKHAPKINHTIIISPDFCQWETDRNILYQIMKDYEQHHDVRSEQLKEILTHFPKEFNPQLEAGFIMAADNPRLFHYYWQNKDLIQDFVQHYTGEYKIDIGGFLAVRRSMFDIGLENCTVPITVIYGKHDRIISIEHEINNLPELFSNFKIIEITKASHYPHIEMADEVLAVIKNALISCYNNYKE